MCKVCNRCGKLVLLCKWFILLLHVWEVWKVKRIVCRCVRVIFSGVQKVCKCIRVLYTGLECMLSALEHL